jgi:hypothetical protein
MLVDQICSCMISNLSQKYLYHELFLGHAVRILKTNTVTLRQSNIAFLCEVCVAFVRNIYIYVSAVNLDCQVWIVDCVLYDEA